MTRWNRLRWLWLRLRVMSAREVALRLVRAIGTRLQPRAERDFPGATHPMVAVTRKSRFVAGEHRQLFLPDCTALDAVTSGNLLAGRLRVFGRWLDSVPSAKQWHTDPFTGNEWPLHASGRIAYRPGNSTGDVRIVWEASRLQHLFALAILASQTPAHARAAQQLFGQQLLDWHAANPPGIGVHYLSAMEESLRLIALFHAFDLVRTDASPEVRTALAEIAVNHAWHIERRLSLHSSAGNHTIAEAVGLLYAGVLLPECAWARRWKHTAIELISAEAPRQIDADGGGIEQATWYLLFITDLLGLAQALLAHAGEAAIPAMDAALGRARSFLGALAGGPDDLPRIGDADDGYALCPELRISWRGSPSAPGRHTFRTAGLSVASFSGMDRLVFLHNQLGMEPLFGHGHADCLSVLFRWRGHDLLIDPGTFQYGSDEAQRRYFRSTRAHNTAAVAGADQAEQLTAFIWTRPYHCTLESTEFTRDAVRLLARHDGYRHLGITHWRGVVYRRDRYLATWDHFAGSGGRAVALQWHLGCDVRHTNPPAGLIELVVPGSEPVILHVSGGVPVVNRGATTPLLGWRSPTYATVQPCHTLTIAAPTPATEPIVTSLRLDAGMADATSKPNIEDFADFISQVHRTRET